MHRYTSHPINMDMLPTRTQVHAYADTHTHTHTHTVSIVYTRVHWAHRTQAPLYTGNSSTFVHCAAIAIMTVALCAYNCTGPLTVTVMSCTVLCILTVCM